MFLLDDSLSFPPAAMADKDGLLAVGGDLSTERLLLAYRSGIFPWYNDDEPILWWCPDPRMVLYPEELKISSSMRALIRKNKFEFTINTCFEEVIKNCSSIIRKENEGTWIAPAIRNAYTLLHTSGHAHSAETWLDGKLVGGLYGIIVGNVFCGESMFSTKSNASKFAFINYVQQLQKQGIVLIDCQVHTYHLESLGARMISRNKFVEIVSNGLS